jgi:anti-anti-sigma factor
MTEEVVNDGFRINAQQVDPDVLLIAIAGDIDMQTAPETTAFLTEATPNSPRHLILDLSAVTFLARTASVC